MIEEPPPSYSEATRINQNWLPPPARTNYETIDHQPLSADSETIGPSQQYLENYNGRSDESLCFLYCAMLLVVSIFLCGFFYFVARSEHELQKQMNNITFQKPFK